MSKTIKPVIKESFMLRRIVPKDLAAKYFKGEFLNRKVPQTKIKTSKNFVKLGKELGKDRSYEVYRFRDKSNNAQTILTTNHSFYEQKDGEMNNLIRCRYCMRNNMKDPVGIPISMNVDNTGKATFVCIDPCCDFGCAFSHLKRITAQNKFYVGPMYMNAEQLLNCMYCRMHPDKRGEMIQAKPDFDLLRNNGGPLTDEEFDSGSAKYISMPNIIVLPAKKQFIKLHRRRN